MNIESRLVFSHARRNYFETEWRIRVNAFTKMLANAKKCREEALQMLAQVDAGTAELESGISRQRVIELLNGTIADYNQIIKRLTQSRYS
jgi:SOS response regulatory protein OraA/RecX